MKNNLLKVFTVLFAASMMVSNAAWSKTIYLDVSGPTADNPWNRENAYFQILGNGDGGNWIHMNRVANSTCIYEAECSYTSIKFERRSPNWNDHWNMSQLTDVPSDKNLFIIKNWNGNAEACEGEWSTYTPCTNEMPSTFYYLAGEGVGKMPTWNASGLVMLWDCDKKVFYYTFKDLDANTTKYQFKLNPSTDTSWGHEINANNIDNNYKDYANLELFSIQDSRITFSLSEKSDVTLYTDGSKVWAATPTSPTPTPKLTGTYYLKGDMWLQSSGNGWIEAGDGQTPKLVINDDKTEAVGYYVIPKSMFQRIEFKLDGTASASTIAKLQNDGGYAFNTNSSKAEIDKDDSRARKVTLVYKASDGILHASAEQPNQKSGWTLAYRKTGVSTWTEVAMNDQGEKTLEGLESSQKYYIKITDGTSGIHGVNWFGGLYIDMTNSQKVDFNSKATYYKNGDFQWPINSQNDPVGVFYPQESKITVAFDGGVIIFKEATAPTPIEDPVTVTFNSNYGSAVAEQVIEKGSNATKPTDPTKSENEFKGWYQNADFSGEQFNFDNTTIDEDITLYAKWEYNGPTYMVNGSNLGITPWNDQDWDKNMETMPEMTKVDDHLEYEVHVAFLKDNDIRFKLLPCRTHYGTSTYCWDNCRSWNNYFSVERSSNLATYEYQGDNNIQFNLTGEGAYGITICYDGVNVYSKIEPLTLYTVTFMNGTSEFATQQVAAGYNPTKPATDPEKAGYNFLGWSETDGGDVVDVTTVTILDAKTFYAKWELKAVASVTLDPTSLKLVENGATGTITPTILPEDVLETTITWTSDNEDVATVENGVVTPVSKGTATITCTVSNAAGSASATCAVTVISEDEDCEIVWKEKYKGVGEIVNPFVPGGQGGPEKITHTKIRIGNNGSGTNYYAYDDNGIVKANTTGEYWVMEEAGKTGSNIQMYYLKSESTGKYMYRQTEKHCDNGDWWTYTVATDTKSETDAYKWYAALGSGNKGIIVSKLDGSGNQSANNTDCILHRRHWTVTWLWSGAPANSVTAGRGATQGGGGNTDMQSAFTDTETIDNPDAKQPTVEKDGKTYYRFAENGTMTCTLDNALKVGDSVSVYCYNTTSTTVSGELRIGGAKVAGINLAAGVSVFPYKVAAAGGTEIVVATSSSDFCVAGVEVDRQGPDVPKPANLAWDADLSGGVNRMVSEGAFQHVATAKGAGAITYSSSDEAVATVDANGTVTPVDAGTTTITATLEQEGCYEEGTISYTLDLTDLPKPVITFTTLPSDAPQGSVQTVEVTTTGGDNFALAITDGTGATLTIVENTETKITATLAFDADATNIELTATTDRKEGEWAAASAVATATVSACYTEGVDIFTFTMQGSAAATNQPAEGLVGGSVTQNELGTVGTEDNPATIDVLKIKMNGNKYVYDNAGKVEVKDNEGGDECKWAMIATGDSYKPNWSSNTYTLYYLKNISTNKYMKRGAGRYGSNSDWYYYTTVTDATLGNGDEYKWFIATDNGTGIVNLAGVGGSIDQSDHLHIANQYHGECNQYAAKPAVPCGITKNNFNDYSKIYDKTSLTTTMPNPDMIKSVTVGEKTYYIISSTGQITINCEMEVGDKIHLDVYDRQLAVVYEDEVIVDANKSQYVYTTDNEYLCIAGISIWRQKAGEFITPTLQWDADLTEAQEVEPGEVLTHTATSLPKTMAIMGYSSSDENVATVDANGEVTIATEAAVGATATITATLPAIGCYEEATATYTVKVVQPAPAILQDAIDAIPAGETLTLTIDYIGQDGVIDKAITINGENKEVGTLTVTENGKLTVGSAINMNEFTLWEAEGNTSTSAKSAQVIGADNLNISGDTWFNVSFESGANIDFGWYTMAVPFNVDNANGVYYLKNGVRTKATLDKDYSLHHYNSVTRAQGKKGWEKYSNTLNPGELYLIAMDNDLNVSTFCFKKAGGNLGGDAELALKAYPSSDPINANWNGVGNSTLVYRNVSFSGDKVQVFNHADDAFQVYPVSEVSFVVGGAFFAQSEGEETLTLTEATDPAFLRTPARKRAVTMDELNVRIGKDENSFTDQIFLSAEDDALDSYEIGHDLVKMSYNTPKVAQMAINAYGVSLCDAELPWNASNEAIFPLTITAPKAGTYTIYLNGEAQSALLLYQNGHYVCDLTAGAYTMDLGKGKNSEYSLVMTRPNETVLTGNEDVQQALKVKKIILDNQMYILKDNQMINAIGTIVK